MLMWWSTSHRATHNLFVYACVGWGVVCSMNAHFCCCRKVIRHLKELKLICTSHTHIYTDSLKHKVGNWLKVLILVSKRGKWKMLNKSTSKYHHDKITQHLSSAVVDDDIYLLFLWRLKALISCFGQNVLLHECSVSSNDPHNVITSSAWREATVQMTCWCCHALNGPLLF